MAMSHKTYLENEMAKARGQAERMRFALEVIAGRRMGYSDTANLSNPELAERALKFEDDR